MPIGWPYIMMYCWMINIQYLPNITIHNTTCLAHFVISPGFSNGKDRPCSPYFPTYTWIWHEISVFSKQACNQHNIWQINKPQIVSSFYLFVLVNTKHQVLTRFKSMSIIYLTNCIKVTNHHACHFDCLIEIYLNFSNWQVIGKQVFLFYYRSLPN